MAFDLNYYLSLSIVAWAILLLLVGLVFGKECGSLIGVAPKLSAPRYTTSTATTSTGTPTTSRGTTAETTTTATSTA